jgi:ethanolamine ammonia-lyase large subunit
MTFAHTIGNTPYAFAGLRELPAKATPLCSGDALARVAAHSAEERVAAQFALADLPLAQFLSAQAAAQLHFYLTEARHRQLTGVSLRDEARQLEKG